MYNPNLEDILWARNVIDLIADGGVLVFPSTLLIYKVNHKEKTLVLQNKQRLKESDMARDTHSKTIDVFSLSGYTVTPEL